jgi:hypothetical protein
MTLQDFDEEVRRNPLMKVAGLHCNGSIIFVEVKQSALNGDKPEVGIVDVSVEELKRMPRNRLSGWLLGRPILVHLSRVVGYWSTIHNWNRSKAAELKDRQKGSYTLNGHQ